MLYSACMESSRYTLIPSMETYTIENLLCSPSIVPLIVHWSSPSYAVCSACVERVGM